MVKPTGWEQSQIDKKLKEKHPHMMSESWAKSLKKKVRKQLKRVRRTPSYRFGKSGLSRKEVERMGGK